MQHVSSHERSNTLLELWPQLPVEISYHIIRQLDAKGLMALACVTKGSNTVIYDDTKLWRDLAVNHHFPKDLALADSYRKLIQREAKNKPNRIFVATMMVALGSHHVDAGVAGDELPDLVIPSAVQMVTGRLGQRQHYAGQDAKHITSGSSGTVMHEKKIINIEHVVQLIEQVYVSHPQAQFDQPLILGVSARNLQSELDRLMYACCERLDVPAIACVASEELALYSHGYNNGMVVDVGYEWTTIIPIVDGKSP